jgi:hypothetical protein
VRPRAPRPSLTPEQKRAAREHAEACKDTASNFKIAVAVLAVPAAAMGVLAMGFSRGSSSRSSNERPERRSAQ